MSVPARRSVFLAAAYTAVGCCLAVLSGRHVDAGLFLLVAVSAVAAAGVAWLVDAAIEADRKLRRDLPDHFDRHPRR